MRRVLLAMLVTTCTTFGACSLARSSPADYLFPVSHQDVVLGPPEISEAQCRTLPNTVWVSVPGARPGSKILQRAYAGCIRYFPSQGVAPDRPLLLYLHGDRVERTGVPGSTRSAQLALAQHIEKITGMPTVVLARPGVYGSTGLNHQLERRGHTEVVAVSAAIDRIKERWGIQRISLVGQSGGGHLAMSMVVTGRSDLDAIVLSGAPVAVHLRATKLSHDASHDVSTGQDWARVFDPIDHLSQAAQDSRRKVYLIADPQDQRIPFSSVQAFVEAARITGLPLVVLQPLLGGGPQHHSHLSLALQVMAWHRAGVSDVEISRRVNVSMQTELP